MHRIYIDNQNIKINSTITINGDDYFHLCNVLRVKPKEKIEVCDGNNKVYLSEFISASNSNALIKILELREINSELPVRITLFQGIPKSKKMDTIIQKSVELGVNEIVPLETKRCISSINDNKKYKRWQKIAYESAKQAKRGIIPQISNKCTIQSFIDNHSAFDHILIAYENQDNYQTYIAINRIMPNDKIAIIIGPEGGFEPEEIKAISNIGGKVISLGKRILRTETASLALLSILVYKFELS
jgi:16S rRNA (uracil1498-N3)-methyltransferase